MFETVLSRTGDPVLRISGTYLHSRYDPRSESRNFIERNISAGNPSLIIIIGETGGYLSSAAHDLFPDSRIASVILSSEINLPSGTGFSCYYADRVEDMKVLGNSIQEFNVDSVAMVSWRPSAQVWPEAEQTVLGLLRVSFRIATGNIQTTAGFGRRWLANLIRNCLDLPDQLCSYRVAKPIMIAASGPSLDDVLRSCDIPFDRFEIWALPSSLAALHRAGISPNAIVSTDPGFYASLHYPQISRFPDALLLYPLTSYPGLPERHNQQTIIDQSGLLERRTVETLALPSLQVPSNGTVSGTAFDLAVQYEVPVFLCGLDFAVLNLREHAIPHPFDDLRRRNTVRLSPFENVNASIMLDRYTMKLSYGWRSNIPLSTYADWFSKRVSAMDRTSLFRVNPTPQSISGFRACPISDISTTISDLKTRTSDSVIRRVEICSYDTRRGLLETMLDSIRTVLENRAQSLRDANLDVVDPSVDPADRLVYTLATGLFLKYRKAILEGDRESAHREYVAAISVSSDFIDRQLRRIREYG